MKLGAAEKIEAPSASGKLTLDLANCVVRLGGDVRNEVPKLGVTAPEIVLLRAIHGGADTVVKVVKTGSHQVSASQEKQRLLALYGTRNDQSKLIETLFPGFRPQLPQSIEEVDELAAAEFSNGEETQNNHEDILS